MLGLGLDEAIVNRNAGGRANADVLRTLTALRAVSLIEGLDLDAEIVVMHHTDCGTSRFATDEHREFAASLHGVTTAEVEAKRLDDPSAAVAADGETLRASPLIPPAMRLTGLVYGVASGRVDHVVTSEGDQAA